MALESAWRESANDYAKSMAGSIFLHLEMAQSCELACWSLTRMNHTEVLLLNVAQQFMRMAEGIREGKPVSPDFDVAVKRHQLLDALRRASDTAIRQIL